MNKNLIKYQNLTYIFNLFVSFLQHTVVDKDLS